MMSHLIKPYLVYGLDDKGKSFPTSSRSRYGYVYLLKHKHEVFETFKVFKNEVENQLGKTIKALRSDRGGKYISQEFKDYLKACGIVQQLPLIPTHNNDVSKRRNHTLLDMVKSMMNLTTLPLSFWDYALEKVPNLSYLKVWGSEALVKRDTPDKLQQRSVKCIFIGYPKETIGFEPPQEEEILIRRLDGSKLIFKKKTDMDGIVHTYKARLVAKGYTQFYGVDYEETLSPVDDISAIRILISIAAFYDYGYGNGY
ncbi:retrotransposon protein, putative, ty1-copia subclass [Tanacetum coccineum]